MRYFTILFLSIVFIVSAANYPVPQADELQTNPIVVNGVLDLKNWDFTKDGSVNLYGDWHFFWNQLLTPSQYRNISESEKPRLLKFPGYWNDYEYENQRLTGDGFATFVLTILLPEDHHALSLRIKDIQTAYRLFANGEEVAKAGVVGKSRESSIPRYSPQVADLNDKGTEITLVLQVSNYHHRKGGAWEKIKLGTESDMRQLRENRLTLEIFLVTCIFTMGLYHLLVYFHHRADRSGLYFSLFCFVISLRSLTTGERYIDHLFPGVHWEIVHKVEYLTFYIATVMFFLFMGAIFPSEFSKRLYKPVVSIGSAFAAVVAFTPARIYTHTVQVYQAFTAMIGVYLIFVLVRAIQHKRESSIILSSGFFFLFISVVNEILHTNQIINTGFYLAVGIFLFVSSQALVVSLRASKMVKTIENQATELTKTNDAYRLEIIERKKLEKNLVESHLKFEQSRIAIIMGLAKLAEYRDENTGMHLERMQEYARMIARQLSELPDYQNYITEHYIEDLYQSAILHDIGKVGIPDSILLKPGKLTDTEFNTIQRHCSIGGDAISNVESKINIQSFLTLGKEIAYNHHEKWDGTGYPFGLAEEKIPLSARIISLADVYDALTSTRPYKKAFSHEKAKSIIVEGEGKHFDPTIVQAFLLQENEFDKIRETYGQI